MDSGIVENLVIAVFIIYVFGIDRVKTDFLTPIGHDSRAGLGFDLCNC